jgi:hypothetical protein
VIAIGHGVLLDLPPLDFPPGVVFTAVFFAMLDFAISKEFRALGVLGVLGGFYKNDAKDGGGGGGLRGGQKGIVFFFLPSPSSLNFGHALSFTYFYFREQVTLVQILWRSE